MLNGRKKGRRRRKNHAEQQKNLRRTKRVLRSEMENTDCDRLWVIDGGLFWAGFEGIFLRGGLLKKVSNGGHSKIQNVLESSPFVRWPCTGAKFTKNGRRKF
jgi:hypothetical protein